MDNYTIIKSKRGKGEYHLHTCKECLARKKKEKYEENKKPVQQKAREYYHTNKEKVLEYKAQYRDENRDEINTKWMENYYADIPKQRAKAKKYRVENKDKINAARGKSVLRFPNSKSKIIYGPISQRG